MDIFGGSPKDSAIKSFRECLSKYKHKFNQLTTTDENKQDTADANEVIRLIDDLYQRIFSILEQFCTGPEPKRPTQDTPVEYTFFTDGKIEYLYSDKAAAREFKEYLRKDLKQFPFTYEVGIIESYNGMPVDPPTIVSNRDDTP